MTATDTPRRRHLSHGAGRPKGFTRTNPPYLSAAILAGVPFAVVPDLRKT